MAHFAEIIDGIVVKVIVVGDIDTSLNGVEDGAIGSAFCNKLLGGTWVQTSYNTRGNVHQLGNKPPLRKNYAGIGFTYDTARDAFISPKPYPSWTLNETTCIWYAPIPMPIMGAPWDETTLSWVALPNPSNSTG